MDFKKLTGEELTETFGDVEDKINEQGHYAKCVRNAGSQLEYVELDVDYTDNDRGGCWNFIMRLVVEKVVELNKDDMEILYNDLEYYKDKLYSRFEKNGLDPAKMGDLKVEIRADE